MSSNLSSHAFVLFADDVDHRPSSDAIKAFIKQFIVVYRGHGGIVENTEPVIMEGENDGAKAVDSKNGRIQRKIPMVFHMTIPNRR